MNNVFSIVVYIMVALIVYFSVLGTDKSIDCSDNATLSIFLPICIVVVILLALL